MRQAALDIGTNTVKLLVADVMLRNPEEGDQNACHAVLITPLHEDAVTTRIGQGVQRTGLLNFTASQRTLDAIADFVERARELGAETILAFATSALRDAQNSQEFLDAVKQRTGLTVRVLSGDEEARCAFAGVTSDPVFAGKTIRTIDVGGGSTEICFGDARGLRAHKSLDIGAVRLTEMFCKSDPPTDKEFGDLSDFVAGELRALPTEIARAPSDTLFIATGGTATTLAAIDARRRNHPRLAEPICSLGPASEEAKTYAGVDHYELASLPELLDLLRRMPLAERKKVPGLPPPRADIIVAGAAILWEAMCRCDATRVTVSVRGLRYGLLAIGARQQMC